jgi:hypothetical protein
MNQPARAGFIIAIILYISLLVWLAIVFGQ